MKAKLLPVLYCFTGLPLLAQEPKDPFKQQQLEAASAATAPAKTEDANLPVNIIIQQETYTLPRLEALMLLTAGLSDDGLHEAILKMVQEKAATLDKFILLRTKSGQRAKVEQIDEFPYPTDIDPPRVPETLTLVDTAGIEALSGVKSLTPAVTPASTPTPTPPPDKAAAGGGAENIFPASTSNAGIGLQSTTTPSDFTFKNLGDSLEVDPVLGEDGVTIVLNLALESGSFLGYNAYSDVRQPDFQTQKSNTTVSGTSGKPIFVGTRSKACRSGVTNSNSKENITLDFLIPWAAKIPPVKNPPPRGPEGDAAGPSGEISEAQKKFYADQAAKRYRCQWELISLPKDEAFALTHAAPDDAAIYGKLREMIQAKTASLESLQSIRTRSAQRAKVEEIDEHPYPTEFDPPQVPQTLTIADQRTLDILHNEGGANASPSTKQLAAENGGFGIITHTTPTTFEIRNTGESLEIDMAIGEDGATVDMTLAPEKIRFLTNIQYQGCVQPIFEAQKLNTNVTLRINVPMLVGTMSRPVNTGVKDGNMEDRIWLAFVTVFDQ